MISNFRCIGFEGSNRLRTIQIDLIVVLIDKVTSAAKINKLDVKSVINENIFSFYISMGDPTVVQMANCGDQLAEDNSS